MTKARRILIVGSAGSGKSTLARMIGDRLGLPVYHMDREVFWLPGWVERDKADQMAQIARIVAQDTWVFEGNHSSSFAMREARAETLIWLDVPVWKRLLRVSRRQWQGRGKVRADAADGCAETMWRLPGFLWFIFHTARASHRKLAALFAQSVLPKHRLTTFAEVDAFVRALPIVGADVATRSAPRAGLGKG